jgi:hypothetical protein
MNLQTNAVGIMIYINLVWLAGEELRVVVNILLLLSLFKKAVDLFLMVSGSPINMVWDVLSVLYVELLLMAMVETTVVYVEREWWRINYGR